MIQYFQEGLRPSVRAQLDTQSRDLDSWEEAIEKAVNAKAKALLQSSTSTRNIDSRCPWENRPAKKLEKNSGGKNKSTNFVPADTSNSKQSSSIQQTSSAHPKKDYRGGLWRERRRDQNSPAMGINDTLQNKKVDLSQIDCFQYRKKGHYANKYPQKRKQESKN